MRRLNLILLFAVLAVGMPSGADARVGHCGCSNGAYIPSASEANWSPDGSLIAYTRDADDEAIYVMRADGTHQRPVVAIPGLGVDEVDWSPDGRRLVFSGYDGDQYDIYAANADGSGVVRLTGDPEDDYYAEWSRDGSKIAFVSERTDERAQIYVMNADGTDQHRLVADADGWDIRPAWSPDGTKIAFVGGSED